jgi:cobalamin biosynthesis protein CbiD
MADYFSFAVSEALKHSMKKMVFSCFPGKILKMAAGAGCTHYSKSTIDLEYLAGIAAEEGVGNNSLKSISCANTVRHAFTFIPEGNVQKVCARMSKLVRERIKKETHDAIKAEVLIISYENKILYHSE